MGAHRAPQRLLSGAVRAGRSRLRRLRIAAATPARRRARLAAPRACAPTAAMCDEARRPRPAGTAARPIQAEGLDGVAGRVAEEVGEQADRRSPSRCRRARSTGRTSARACAWRRPATRPTRAGRGRSGRRTPPWDRGVRRTARPRCSTCRRWRVKAPRPFEQPAAALATDQVADVVADDRGRGGDRDHELDLQLPLAGEHAAGDQRGLARDRQRRSDSAITSRNSSG